MNGVLQFALLGLGAGAVYALLAQGVVLIYRGSGVLNLAHGAFAMVSAYVFHETYTEYDWPLPAAILAGVISATVLGILTDQLILRRMRRTSTLAQVIATLGVLITVQGAAFLVWGAQPVYVPPLLPQDQIVVPGLFSLVVDRVWMVGIAVLITVVLLLVWRYTRVGWVASAVAENRRAAAALGWSPEATSATTWAVGAALAGVAGILIAPITQLTTTNLTLIVIAALAAGLIGGFTSFPLTLLGGLAIGVGQSLASTHSAWAEQVIPFAVIVIVLVVRGSSLPGRGYVPERLPSLGSGRVNLLAVGAATVVVSVVVALLLSRDWLSAITTTAAICVVLLSLVVLIGYAGQLSLAQYALAGTGALVCSRLVADLGVPFVPAAVAGIASAAGIGLLFGIPALRTRGVNLAVVTLGLGVAAQAVLFNNNAVNGGAAGLRVGGQTLFGLDIDALDHPERYAVFAVVCFVLCTMLVANLRRGRIGRQLISVRANERAAAALGVSVLRAKMWAFGLSGAIAGLGGILLTFQLQTARFQGFDPMTSINSVAQVILGGVGYVLGPLLGSLFAPNGISGLLNPYLQGIASWLALIGGVSLILTLMYYPNGFAQETITALRGLGRRLTPRARGEVRPPAGAPASVEAPVDLPGTDDVARVVPRRLTIEGLRVTYGGVVAVDGITVEVLPGEVVGLIGPNGAGKTSLMDAVSGFQPYSGTVAIDGVPIDGWRPHRRAAAGMGRSFQSLELFDDLSVRENLMAGADDGSLALKLRELFWPSKAGLSPVALAAVRDFGLSDVVDLTPAELPYGQRRLVGIARAVAAGPSVLLLDEPVSGLDSRESSEFAGLVRHLADDLGMAILVIEHDMDFVMNICDRVVVMDFGHEVTRGTPERVRTDPAAIAAYLGDDAVDAADDVDPAAVATADEGKVLR